MAPDSSTTTSGSLEPASYGKACAGCVRAKCKCFYRADGSGCERCQRLGKACEPAKTTRKRKIDGVPLPEEQARSAPPPQPSSSSSSTVPVMTAEPVQSRLEEKLDDLVSLLRAQAAGRGASQVPDIVPGSGSDKIVTPSTSSASMSTDSPSSCSATTAATYRGKAPDVLIDMNSTSVLQLLRPTNAANAHAKEASVIHGDIALHVDQISEAVAEESLAIFREVFLSTFPAVHIPEGMKAAELRAQKPFLWLVVMALTARDVAMQFAMEETIWGVISKRVVVQQLASLDLLLGVVCFASWSHYYKQDKPFMTMLSQVAVVMAFELGLHKDVAALSTHRAISAKAENRLRYQEQVGNKQKAPSLEERRSILAVFHLTSASWISYRKTEPLRWTRCLDSCLNILAEGQETKLDILLATQIKCQIITNSLTCLPRDEDAREDAPSVPSKGLIMAMLGRLKDLRQSLPDSIASDRIAQFYLTSAETTILESFLSTPHSPTTATNSSATGTSHFRRLQDLESILTSVERWLNLFLDMPLRYWPGTTMDTFSQLTHSLVVLFRLSTHQEPGCGWDRDEVRRRADVLAILDRACELMDAVPGHLGIVDAEGPRSGLFFKTPYLLRAIKSLFAAELGAQSRQIPDEGVASRLAGGSDLRRQDYVTMKHAQVPFLGNEDANFSLSNEPWWLSDLLNMGPSWDVDPEELLYTPYVAY